MEERREQPDFVATEEDGLRGRHVDCRVEINKKRPMREIA